MIFFDILSSYFRQLHEPYGPRNTDVNLFHHRARNLTFLTLFDIGDIPGLLISPVERSNITFQIHILTGVFIREGTSLYMTLQPY